MSCLSHICWSCSTSMYNDPTLRGMRFVSSERIEHVAIKEDSLPIQSHNFTLSCAVVGPYDSISWTKDGVPLDGTNSSNRKSHMSMMNNSLHFSPVTTYDNGFYRCVAENVFRNHSSPEHQLLVNCEYSRHSDVSMICTMYVSKDSLVRLTFGHLEICLKLLSLFEICWWIKNAVKNILKYTIQII